MLNTSKIYSVLSPTFGKQNSQMLEKLLYSLERKKGKNISGIESFNVVACEENCIDIFVLRTNTKTRHNHLPLLKLNDQVNYAVCYQNKTIYLAFDYGKNIKEHNGRSWVEKGGLMQIGDILIYNQFLVEVTNIITDSEGNIGYSFKHSTETFGEYRETILTILKKKNNQYRELASWFIAKKKQLYRHDKAVRNANIEKASQTIEKLIRLDEFTIEEVADVLAFSLSDSFWSHQVKTIPPLRTKSKNPQLKEFLKFEVVRKALIDNRKNKYNKMYKRENFQRKTEQNQSTLKEGW